MELSVTSHLVSLLSCSKEEGKVVESSVIKEIIFSINRTRDWTVLSTLSSKVFLKVVNIFKIQFGECHMNIIGSCSFLIVLNSILCGISLNI